MTLQKAVAMRISNLLIENNMTRYALSKKICISEQAIKYIIDERNADIKLSTVAQIADGFDLSLQEFFSDPLFNGDFV